MVGKVEDLRTIYLHIGQHKTGTTAIQDFLQLNQNELSRDAVLYPSTGYVINAQHKLSWSVKSVIPKWVRNQFPEFSVTDKGRTLFRELNREINASDASTIVISSENFYIDSDASLLADYLSSYKVKIIAYLRRQDALVQSLYLQALKDPYLALKLNAYEYYRQIKYPLNCIDQIDEWISKFGKENVIVRPYRKTAFNSGSLINDFMSAIGISNLDDYRELPQRSNRRLHPALAHFLVKLYERNLNIDERKEIVGYVQEYNEKIDSSKLHSDPGVLSEIQRQEILERFNNVNRDLTQLYPQSDGRFFGPLDVDDGDKTLIEASWRIIEQGLNDYLAERMMHYTE